MDISVIVPIYGVEKFIEKSLRSLFSQTKTEGVEFILVNDQTKDRSIEIAREVIADFPTLDIKIIEHETNQGVAAARQSGMDAASGNYTIHFDPDDWCDPEMLEELFDSAKSNDADIVGCDFWWSYIGNEVYSKQQIPSTSEEFIDRLLNGCLQGSLWCRLIKREIYVNNWIKITPGLNLCEDLLSLLKVVVHCSKINYLPKAYYHYMQRGGSYVNSLSHDSILNLIRVVEEIESYYRELGILDRHKESLTARKSNNKQTILRGAAKSDRKRYSKLYPEVTWHIVECIKSDIRNRNLRLFSWRFATYFAYYNRFELLDFALWCQKKIGNKRY